MTAERFGTCRHAWGHEWVHTVESPHPHRRPERFLVVDEFICRLVASSDAPPPMLRHESCYRIEVGDCEICRHYAPASVDFVQLLGKRRKAYHARMRRRARAKAKAGG